MTFEQFLKKNMKRITRLERELAKLFDGTSICTSIEIEQDTFRSSGDDPKFEIYAYTDTPCKGYYLSMFANMTAMITQIKHDVKTSK